VRPAPSATKSSARPSALSEDLGGSLPALQCSPTAQRYLASSDWIQDRPWTLPRRALCQRGRASAGDHAGRMWASSVLCALQLGFSNFRRTRSPSIRAFLRARCRDTVRLRTGRFRGIVERAVNREVVSTALALQIGGRPRFVERTASRIISRHCFEPAL
jgi:hypothetical protein